MYHRAEAQQLRIGVTASTCLPPCEDEPLRAPWAEVVSLAINFNVL